MICSKIIFLLKFNFYLDREKHFMENTIQHNCFKLYQLAFDILLEKKNQWQYGTLYNSFIKNHLCGLTFFSEVNGKRILILFMLYDQLPASIKILSWIHWFWKRGNQNIFLTLLYTHSWDDWNYLSGLVVGTFVFCYYYISWHIKILKNHVKYTLFVGWNK